MLLTDSPTNDVKNRETMIENMFEKFRLEGIYIANQAALGMYSARQMTGLVLDCGYETTFAARVYEGYAIKDANFAGKGLYDFLLNEAVLSLPYIERNQTI